MNESHLGHYTYRVATISSEVGRDNILRELRAESKEIILGILRSKSDFQPLVVCPSVSLSLSLSLSLPVTKYKRINIFSDFLRIRNRNIYK